MKEAYLAMKRVTVVGAAIVKDGKVLCAQRDENRSLANKWEFPGGKVEPYESPAEALCREVDEELLCQIEIGEEVCTSTYEYDFGIVELHVFICHLRSGQPKMTEHKELIWVAPPDMPKLDWAPADLEAVRLISNLSF